MIDESIMLLRTLIFFILLFFIYKIYTRGDKK